MPKWMHGYSTIELAMRVYVHVAKCHVVAARKSAMALKFGEQVQIARDVSHEFNCSRSQAARHVRAALDLLGFGEPVRDRTHCGLKKPGKRMGSLTFGRNLEAPRP